MPHTRSNISEFASNGCCFLKLLCHQGLSIKDVRKNCHFWPPSPPSASVPLGRFALSPSQANLYLAANTEYHVDYLVVYNRPMDAAQRWRLKSCLPTSPCLESTVRVTCTLLEHSSPSSSQSTWLWRSTNTDTPLGVTPPDHRHSSQGRTRSLRWDSS